MATRICLGLGCQRTFLVCLFDRDACGLVHLLDFAVRLAQDSPLFFYAIKSQI